jgi:hypothetical protein
LAGSPNLQPTARRWQWFSWIVLIRTGAQLKKESRELSMSISTIRCELLMMIAVIAFVAALTSDPGFAAKREGVKQDGTSSVSDYPTSIRRPRGIYVVVVPDTTHGAAKADFDALVSNPAVSGLAIRMFWSSLQPAKDRYDFSQLDTAFASAAAAHKTVQLILVPGFGTPTWVLSEIASCDDLLTAPAEGGAPEGKHAGHAAAGKRSDGARGGHEGRHAADASTDSGGHEVASSKGQASCGKVTFEVSEGRAHTEKQQLPLPWNPVYKRYWKAFLAEVAARFGGRDTLVSIAVAGPTAESVEIIVPRAGDQLERWAQLLELFYRNPSYHRSDKAFVDEWDAAVSLYGELFRNITIVLTRGSGLLNFTRGQGSAAQASIVSSFAAHSIGANAKATQTSGMKACRETEAGIKGVKELSSSGPVLGGAQFDTSFSQKPAAEGCRASCDKEAAVCQSVTPALALSNVLSVYFDGTPAGNVYGASNGTARMNYLQIYEKDIQFASTQPAVQTTLEQASHRLLMQAR